MFIEAAEQRLSGFGLGPENGLFPVFGDSIVKYGPKRNRVFMAEYLVQ